VFGYKFAIIACQYSLFRREAIQIAFFLIQTKANEIQTGNKDIVLILSSSTSLHSHVRSTKRAISFCTLRSVEMTSLPLVKYIF